jgi:hypothetical protein
MIDKERNKAYNGMQGQTKGNKVNETFRTKKTTATKWLL